MTLTDQARLFAMAAHGAIGQKRKYTGEPYHVHCIEVARTLGSLPYGDAPEEVVAAGYLHDVLEDTKVSPELLRQIFGTEVTKLVLEVTDTSRPEDGNRAARKALDRTHLSQASADGKTIKLADMLSNSKDICAHDPQFANTYLPEMALLLPHLKGGSPILYARAEAQLLQLIAILDKSPRLGLS